MPRPIGDARLRFEPLPLSLAHPWTIARGTSTAKRNGLLTLEADGVAGFGEAAPNVRYGQSYESAERAFAAVAAAVAGLSPAEPEPWLAAAERAAGADREVVAALDMALWDWRGKKLGRPVWRSLGLDRAMPATSYSIGIDAPEVVRRKVEEAAPFPVLKVKLGAGDDEGALAAVRAATRKRLRVDANEAWKAPGEAARKLAWLAEAGVELVEQPLPAADLDAMRDLARDAKIPLVADESAMDAPSLAPLAGAFDGVNVKLAKCGGITRAVQMIREARRVGLRVMLGCMIESSLGIAAAAQLGSLADWIDLDGNLLLVNDPFAGLAHERGAWQLTDAAGLGVAPAGASSRPAAAQAPPASAD